MNNQTKIINNLNGNIELRYCNIMMYRMKMNVCFEIW